MLGVRCSAVLGSPLRMLSHTLPRCMRSLSETWATEGNEPNSFSVRQLRKHLWEQCWELICLIPLPRLAPSIAGLSPKLRVCAFKIIEIMTGREPAEIWRDISRDRMEFTEHQRETETLVNPFVLQWTDICLMVVMNLMCSTSIRGFLSMVGFVRGGGKLCFFFSLMESMTQCVLGVLSNSKSQPCLKADHC